MMTNEFLAREQQSATWQEIQPPPNVALAVGINAEHVPGDSNRVRRLCLIPTISRSYRKQNFKGITKPTVLQHLTHEQICCLMLSSRVAQILVCGSTRRSAPRQVFVALVWSHLVLSPVPEIAFFLAYGIIADGITDLTLGILSNVMVDLILFEYPVFFGTHIADTVQNPVFSGGYC